MSKYLEKREGSKQMEGLAQDTNLLSDLSFGQGAVLGFLSVLLLKEEKQRHFF